LFSSLQVEAKMARGSAVAVPQIDLRHHVATQAWWRLAVSDREPQQIFVLKPAKKRSAVYRLEGVGPGGTAIIAKRGRMTRLAVELRIYRDVLPLVPTTTLRCYGTIEDQQPGFGWLFLEDAGDEQFSSGRAEHRALAGHWLALLHTSIPAQPAWRTCLPSRDLAYYQTILGLARETIVQSLPNPSLSRSDAATLEAILLSCDCLQARWSVLEEICGVLPHTLVHGDFGAKNVRVRADSEGLRLLPLDWDSAGWGICASDLSQTDVLAYWSIARARWPALEPDALTRLATVGRMFLALESITGEADPLGGDWVDRVMRKMRAYESEIAGALETAGWASP
jgi:hypothetical protein